MSRELQDEFDRQVENLLRKGYPELAGIEADAFVRQVAPLAERLPELPSAGNGSRIPFVLAVRSGVVAAEQAMALVELDGKQGFTRIEADDLERFVPIDGVRVPPGPAYLVADVGTGRDTLDVTPDAALETIARANR